MSNIYIFLGPSLSVQEAQLILPEAHYLPPVRCGDVLRLLRLKPKIIGIIDGYFEKTAAVWHKEILFALEQNVRVVGGASMGALRASELACFGMEAVGDIAQAYLDQQLIDDDEVAVLHDPKTYLTTTDAMVNIRATLDKAKVLNIISAKLHDSLVHKAKSISYHQRNFHHLLEEYSPVDTEEMKLLETLRTWCSAGNFINLKRQDAQQVLLHIAKTKGEAAQDKSEVFNKSNFFRTLYRNITCRPWTHSHDWLPAPEKVAMMARLLDQHYFLLRRLAYLLSTCYAIAIQKNIQIDKKDIQATFEEPWFSLYDKDFLKHHQQYDCDETACENFINRMAKIRALLDQEAINLNHAHIVEFYILLLMKMTGEYVSYKKDGMSEQQILNSFNLTNPLKFHLFSCFAACWCYLEKNFLAKNLIPTHETIREYQEQFRLTHKLYTIELTLEWMKKNDMDEEAFEYFHQASARLSKIVIQGNLNILGPLPLTPDFWLLDSLYLSGFYLEAKALLHDPSKQKYQKNLIIQKNKDNLEKYALALDFIEGEEELIRY